MEKIAVTMYRSCSDPDSNKSKVENNLGDTKRNLNSKF